MKKELGLELKSVSTTEAPALQPYDGTVAELIEKYAGVDKYKVVAFMAHKVLIGRLEAGVLVFADNQQLDEGFLQELRIFNPEKEVLLKKSRQGIKLRIIEDNITDDGFIKVNCVDDRSKFFGAPYQLDDGFVTLREDKRKISVKVPAEKLEERFLVTRSYIISDKTTGLSGYGYYRYLDITD